MSNRFRGYHFQQFNHQRLSLVMMGMPAIEAGVLMRLHVLFGMTRQHFGLNDGHLSVDGHPMKAVDVARWLACNTPQLSVARAEKALLSLYKEHKQVVIKKSGVVRMAALAGEQKDAPTDVAARKRKSLAAKRVEQAVDCLRSDDGSVLAEDALLYRIQAALRCKPKTAAGVWRDLTAAGVVMPATGGFAVRIPVAVPAPSALPPRDCEGGIPREGEVTYAHSDECDMSQSLDHNHKRDTNVSHDHDAHADTRPMKGEDSPRVSLRSKRAPESVRRGGGGGSAEGAASPHNRGDQRTVDVWSVADCDLAAAAVRIFRPSEPAKTKSILMKKLLLLFRYFSDQGDGDGAYRVFREHVSAIETDLISGIGNLKFPERELCARLNESMGIARRGRQGQPAHSGGHR